jgi:hypothetical protein
VLILPMLLGAFQPLKPTLGGPAAVAENQEFASILLCRPCTELGMEDSVHEDVPVMIKYVPQQILFSGFGGEKLQAAWVR